MAEFDLLGGPAERVEPLTHNPLNAVTGGIWRVSAGDRHVVRKVLTDGTEHDGPDWWAASADPSHWNWWRREAEVYVNDLGRWFRPDGIDTPKLLDLEDRDDGSVVLWLEWVDGPSGSAIRIDGLADFARCLGQAQGRLAGESPRLPWLSRGFLHDYAESKPSVDGLLDDDAVWRSPRVAHFLGRWREDLRRLHHNRRELLAIARRCPRTLCHLDVWPPNLSRRSDGSFVLFDWAFCGDGALGEDIANLIPDAVFDLIYPADALYDIARELEAAYLAGVRAVSWDGDERWVKLGIRCTAVKYHWLVGGLLQRLDEGEREVYGGRLVSADALYEARAAGLALMCRWADEARDLA